MRIRAWGLDINKSLFCIDQLYFPPEYFSSALNVQPLQQSAPTPPKSTSSQWYLFCLPETDLSVPDTVEVIHLLHSLNMRDRKRFLKKTERVCKETIDIQYSAGYGR